MTSRLHMEQWTHGSHPWSPVLLLRRRHAVPLMKVAECWLPRGVPTTQKSHMEVENACIWRGTTIGKGIRLNSAQSYRNRCSRCWTKPIIFFHKICGLVFKTSTFYCSYVLIWSPKDPKGFYVKKRICNEIWLEGNAVEDKWVECKGVRPLVQNM